MSVMRPAMREAMREAIAGASAPGRFTLVNQALSILRRPGITASVYLPGIGTISGLQAANYLDSAGTTLATVDSPVGLVLDAAGSVGVELSLPTTSTAGWVANAATLSVDAGRIKCITAGTGDNGAYEDFAVTAGKTYVIVSTLTNAAATSGAGLRAVTEAWTPLALSNAIAAGATGEVRVVATATSSTLRVAFDRRATGTIGDVIYIVSASVREVTGIHATQPTTAAKPILRQTAGKYSWAFDGNDYIDQSSVPFQQADDRAVIIGFNASAAGMVYDVSAATGNPLLGRVQIDASGILYVHFRDDTSTLATLSFTVGLNTTIVMSYRVVSGVRVLRVNGVQRATNSTTLGATTVAIGRIGAAAITTPTSFFTGNVSQSIPSKGTLTDAEMLTLERLVANLTPNAPSF